MMRVLKLNPFGKKKIKKVEGSSFYKLKNMKFSCFNEMLPELILTGVTLFKDQLDKEVEALVGPRYSQNPDRQAYRWGYQDGSIVLNGYKAKIDKPRLRTKEGKEVELETYKGFSDPKNLEHQALEKAICGISSRDYKRVCESIAEGYGLSKSSVSRNTIKATQRKYDELMSRDLSKYSFFAIFIDGKVINGQRILAAVGVTIDAQKVALGIHQAPTENSDATKVFLEGLLERGLCNLNPHLLFVTDGGKGLIKGIKRTFGEHVLLQRCYKHKDANLLEHLPKSYHAECSRRIKLALSMTEYSEAKKELLKLQAWLAGINLSAANSLKEAFNDLLTLHKLKVPATLRRSLKTTNIIESSLSIIEDKIKRHKKWYDSKQIHRAVATAFLEAETRWHKMFGVKHIKTIMCEINKYYLDYERKVA
ncbi:MAG: transposase [Nanoarchaeota archaeon]|nr:transposase [Nanoarchaeota archaeon]